MLSACHPFEGMDTYHKTMKAAYSFEYPPERKKVFDGVSQGPDSRRYSQTLAKEASDYLLSSSADSSWTDLAFGAMQQGTSAAKDIDGMSTALLATAVPAMLVAMTRQLAATALETPASAKTFVLKKTTALMPANC